MLRSKRTGKKVTTSSKASTTHQNAQHKQSPLLANLSSLKHHSGPSASFRAFSNTPSHRESTTKPLLTLSKDQVSQTYNTLPKSKKDFFLRMPTTDLPYSLKLDYHYVIMPNDIETLDRQIKTLNRLPPPIPELAAPETLITRHMQVGDDILDAEMEIELETYQAINDYEHQKSVRKRQKKALAEDQRRQQSSPASIAQKSVQTSPQEPDENKMRRARSKYYAILPPPVK